MMAKIYAIHLNNSPGNRREEGKLKSYLCSIKVDERDGTDDKKEHYIYGGAKVQDYCRLTHGGARGLASDRTLGHVMVGPTSLASWSSVGIPRLVQRGILRRVNKIHRCLDFRP